MSDDDFSLFTHQIKWQQHYILLMNFDVSFVSYFLPFTSKTSGESGTCQWNRSRENHHETLSLVVKLNNNSLKLLTCCWLEKLFLVSSGIILTSICKLCATYNELNRLEMDIVRHQNSTHPIQLSHTSWSEFYRQKMFAPRACTDKALKSNVESSTNWKSKSESINERDLTLNVQFNEVSIEFYVKLACLSLHKAFTSQISSH